jgi:hypothetical protein
MNEKDIETLCRMKEEEEEKEEGWRNKDKGRR